MILRLGPCSLATCMHSRGGRGLGGSPLASVNRKSSPDGGGLFARAFFRLARARSADPFVSTSGSPVLCDKPESASSSTCSASVSNSAWTSFALSTPRLDRIGRGYRLALHARRRAALSCLEPGLFTDQATPVQATLFLGAAMSITAFPVLARIISERGHRRYHGRVVGADRGRRR